MAHYKKNSEEVSNSLQVSGYDKGKAGQQTVTVTLRTTTFLKTEKSTTFTVTVVPVVKLTIQQPPTVKAVMQGDEFNPRGLVALAEFENGAVPGVTVGPAQLKISGYSKDKGGVQTVIADYYGKQASFDVRVAALTSIAVSSPPDNTQYFTGEDINLAGLVVTGTWEGAGEKRVAVTQANLSSFDKNRAAKQDVVVTYSGKTASFLVTFVGMQSLSVDRPPAKLNYENGENLDLDGLTVQGTRMGATSIEMVDVSRLKVSGYERFKVGNQTITVTLGGKTATFRVTVAPNPFVGTWHGTWRDTYNGEVRTGPVILIMTDDTWAVSIPKTERTGEGHEFSGTYTRDSNNLKYVKLRLNKTDKRFAPDAAEILSHTEVKLSGNSSYYIDIANNITGITLTKAR
jgi:hypothetical protein